MKRAFSITALVVSFGLSACQAPEVSSSADAASEATTVAGSGAAGTADRALTHSAEGFALWSAEELRQRDAALSTRIGGDFSARETLRDYGDHRFRYLRREGDGFPEQHDEIIDVVIVQSGEGVLQLGGTLVDPQMSSPGEWRGSRLDGGERYPLGPGDVMHIPATVPHAFLVPEGRHFTYVLVKFPAP